MSWRVRLAASTTNAKRFSSRSRQSSTVTRAIGAGTIALGQARRKPSAADCRRERVRLAVRLVPEGSNRPPQREIDSLVPPPPAAAPDLKYRRIVLKLSG